MHDNKAHELTSESSLQCKKHAVYGVGNDKDKRLLSPQFERRKVLQICKLKIIMYCGRKAVKSDISSKEFLYL
jgi:hypothetical protein